MPIIGIMASQISGHLWPANSYESIATYTVGAGGSSQIDFTSIPSTYTHLQIRAIARTDRATTGSNIYLRCNNDSTNIYSWHRVEGNGTSASADAASTTSGYQVSIASAAASTTTDVFGTAVIDLLDYRNTNKYKTIRSLSGRDANNTTGVIRFTSGLYQSTSAVSTITLVPDTANNFVQYSHFALYGIKGA